MRTIYRYDVIVVGAGHAGAEAAAAAARLGASVALLSSNLDTIARMSCNPSIGGVGKGHIVREIDALDGLMGRATDATGTQFRMLNLRKGPAMHGPRAQTDRFAYQQWMKQELESIEGVSLRQETVERLLIDDTDGKSPRIVGLTVAGDAEYHAQAVVLCTGTFMRGVIHLGDKTDTGGRMGEPTVTALSQSLEEIGLTISRFKTGTPPRINGRTIDYDRVERQPGDERPSPFSFMTGELDLEQIPCWITHSNEQVHQLVRDNLSRAPMYTGQIETTGPRYCPSFETKVVRFADKSSHQIFLEPEGRETSEVYVGGFSTSLPRDVQDEMIHAIVGLERAEILRYGYAIEYDFIPPEQVDSTLQTHKIEGLYLAGQINGTTGYEEAGAQGLVAGANAALRVAGRKPYTFDRTTSYIGVMIDDLVTRGVDEPYRMFTSRAEHRLRLRQDNADRRLTLEARDIGLVGEERARKTEEKITTIERVKETLRTKKVSGDPLEKLLRRPGATWESATASAPELTEISHELIETIENDVRYAGYIARQEVEIERTQKMAERRIPEDFDYQSIDHMRMEAREQLSRFRPADIGQASRIRGITPADIALLVAHLRGGK